MSWWKKKNYSVTRMEFLERGRVEYLEQENKCLRVQEGKIQLEKIKEEREKIKEKMEIITMDLATLPLMQQKYFRQRQLEILAKKRTDN